MPRLPSALSIVHIAYRCLSFAGNDEFYGIYGDYMTCHPLRFLSTVVSRLHGTTETVWPVGLRSLRKLSICTSHIWEGSDLPYSVPPMVAVSLLLLPNLEVLHLNNFGATDEDEPPLEMPHRISNLKELALVACEMPIEEVDQMIGSVRNLQKCIMLDPVSTDYYELQ